jgi:hypothetical protein
MNMLRNSELKINIFSFYYFYLYYVTLYAAIVVGDDLAAIGKKIKFSVAFVVVSFLPN